MSVPMLSTQRLTSRPRLSLAALALVVSVLGLLVISAPSAALEVSSPAVSVVEGTSSLATDAIQSAPQTAQLAAATASLESGAGPAHGAALSCGAVGGTDSSVSCSGASARAHAHSSSESPLTGFSPASWQQVGAPTPGYGITMVYDGADHYVLAYGTGISDNASAETWAYANGVWTDVTPAYSPPARVSPYLAYDPIDGYVVMFGGWASSAGGPSEYGDTWTYAGGVWTQLHPTYSPSPRDSGVMSWDGKDGYIVLFGSYSGDNDTWSFVGGGWTEQIASSQCTGPGGSTPCPLGVEDASMAYDPTDGYLLMFGGDYYSGGNNYVQDTWSYSAGHWTNLTANPCTSSTCPAGRDNAMMTWDAADGYVLMYGGYAKKDLQDTWKFLGGTWTEVISSCSGGICPPKTDSAGMAYDPVDGFVVMFGGYAQEDSAWKYEAGVWYPLTQNTTPEARYNMALTYDAADNEVVMFGGTDGHQLGSTWTFSNGQWTNATATPCTASTCPGARWGANMTYDAKDGYVVLFGGQDTAGYLRDTWTFSQGTWTESTVVCTGATCPSARSGFALAYDNAAKEVVLFGGDASGTLEQDTWTYSAGAWSQVAITCSASTCPSARTGAAMTFDGADNYLLLWGGQTGASTYVNDTWDFASGAWTEISSGACTYAAPCPGTGAAAQFAYDPGLGKVVLVGGSYGSGVSSSVWYYAGGSWTDAYPTVAPTARGLGAMVYDGALGGLVLFGGWNRAPLGDTWMLVSPVFAQEPYATPAAIDVGQSVVFSAGAIGGGIGSTYTYLWQGLPSGCTVTVPTPTVSCTPTLNGTYYISTVVEDNNNGAGAATSYILAFSVNPLPTVVLSSTASTVDLGQWANFTATMKGGTGTSPQFFWSGLPPTCAAVRTGTLDCQALSSADLGTWVISVQAYDGAGVTSAPATVSLTVLSAPAVVAPTESRTSLDLGQSVTLTTSARGGAGGYTYQWSGLPAGCGGISAQLLCTPSATGTFTPSVTAVDSLGAVAGSATAATPFTVSADPTVSALSITSNSVPVASINLGAPVSFSATTTPGASPDVYVWSGLPTGCTAPSGATSFSCTPTSTGSFLPLLVEVDANEMTATSPASVFSVTAGGALSLQLTASPASFDEGQVTTLSGSVSGGEAPFTYAWSNLPNGCTASASALLTCTPTADGTFLVGLQATDAAGTVAAATVSLQVDPTLSVGSLSASATSLTVGTSLDLSVVVTGGSGSYTYLWSGLPAGCASGNTPFLTCEPTTAGTSTITVSVADTNGAKATSSSVSVVVSAAPAAPAASFTTGATDVDWLILVLVVVALLLGLVSLFLALRRPPVAPPRGPSAAEWSEREEPRAGGGASASTSPSSPQPPPPPTGPQSRTESTASAAGPAAPVPASELAPRPGPIAPTWGVRRSVARTTNNGASTYSNSPTQQPPPL